MHSHDDTVAQRPTKRNSFEGKYPTISEISRKLRHKKRVQPSRLKRPFIWLHIRLTWLLLRLGVNARQCTGLWLALSVTSFMVLLLGTQWAFVVGTLLFMLSAMLDSADGEIARFHKPFMSPEEDLRTHMNGICMDRTAHAINTVLWPLAIAFGLYRCTDNAIALVAGVSLLVFQNVYRTGHATVGYVRETFHDRVRLTFPIDTHTQVRDGRIKAKGILARTCLRLVWWLGSSWHFSVFLLVFSVIDTVLYTLGYQGCPVAFAGLLFCGAVAPILSIVVIVWFARTDWLVDMILSQSQSSSNIEIDDDCRVKQDIDDSQLPLEEPMA